MKNNNLNEYNEDLTSSNWNPEINKEIFKSVNEWIDCNKSWINFYKKDGNEIKNSEKIKSRVKYLKYWESMLDIESIMDRITLLETEIKNSLTKYGEAYYDMFVTPWPEEVTEYLRLIDLKKSKKFKNIDLTPRFPSFFFDVKEEENDS